MGSNEEKKPAEDKKYAQLSRESIRLFTEAASYSDLSESVISVIAEDVNYRLREAVQNSGQFMRHARRRKLTVEDFNRSLHWSDVEPLYGYGNTDPLCNVYVKEAEVFCTEEVEVNLVNLACSSVIQESPAPPSVNAQWLAIEGVPKSQPGSTLAIPTAHNPLNQEKKNGQVGTPVAEELMVYYDQVTKAILGNDEKLLRLALDDLSSNAKISSLLPYLVNFVSVGVKKMSHDLTQLTKLLQTIRSLVTNPSLYLGLEPYLNLLVQSVLYCIVEPLAASINPINDHWVLRDSAAQLLARILREWSTPVNNLNFNTLTALKDIFNDLSKPFCSHYGAIVAIVAFGANTIEKILYPHISHYWLHLIAALKDCSYSNAQIKTDAQKVHGVLLVVSELLIRSRLKTEFQQSVMYNENLPSTVSDDAIYSTMVKNEIYKSEKFHSDEIKKELPDVVVVKSSCDMYKEFYEYFGDSLATRLPYVEVSDVYIPKEIPPIELFLTPELLQTGEELLEIFYEKEDDFKSNSIEDDNSYDERDDISLLSDEHETGPVDLQVKSTVSDPTLGIKLTISKLRRTKPVEEPKPVKKRKIMTVPSPEPWEVESAFDYAPLISHNRTIEFNFEGATPLPRSCLRRRVLNTFNQHNLDSCLLSSEINSRLKKIGKRKIISPKDLFYRRFSSGNLMTIL